MVSNDVVHIENQYGDILPLELVYDTDRGEGIDGIEVLEVIYKGCTLPRWLVHRMHDTWVSAIVAKYEKKEWYDGKQKMF
jgi:hypothetical protein